MQDQGSWDDCPSGVVTAMAGHLRRQKRHKQLRPFIFLGAAALLLSAIGYGLTNRDEPGSPGGITCRETAALFAKYQNQTLDAAGENRVREHLSHCPMCREHYEKLYPSEVRNRSSAETGLFAVAAQFQR